MPWESPIAMWILYLDPPPQPPAHNEPDGASPRAIEEPQGQSEQEAKPDVEASVEGVDDQVVSGSAALHGEGQPDALDGPAEAVVPDPVPELPRPTSASDVHDEADAVGGQEDADMAKKNVPDGECWCGRKVGPKGTHTGRHRNPGKTPPAALRRSLPRSGHREAPAPRSASWSGRTSS